MSPLSPYTVEIEGLSVGYFLGKNRQLTIQSDLSFKAVPGELVALIGGNGIGKSTLLRSVTGFQPYLKGKISLNGKELIQYHPKVRAQMMSFVSTENIRVPNMSVFDLVAFGRFPYTNWLGRLSTDDRDKVCDAIVKVGLAGFENKMIEHISDGERQRAMIARAIAQDTPVIILDEPSAFLDVSNKYEIFHLIQGLAHERNKTIILSTHDLNIAMREVDKLWILTPEGNYEGAPEDAAINGWLDKMFTNPHIGFDKMEGDFYFKKEFKAKVKVIGDGLMANWMLRALNRCGYQIVVKAEPDITITCSPDSWNILKQGTEKNLPSVYEVLKFIEQ
jgi:iron complex transport system ATP-binding protein